VGNKGYIATVAIVSVGIIMMLGLLYFGTRSGVVGNIFPGLVEQPSGKTLGVFAQNAVPEPRTGNLKSTLPTQDPKRITPTTKPVSPSPTLRPIVANTPTVTPMVRTIVQAAPTATPTIATPASIPASGIPSGVMALYVGVGLMGWLLKRLSG
jgi:hypothetical protein